MSKIRVAVIGAGGKMGTRTSKNLAKMTDKYDLMLVENAPKGIESIHARGLDVIPVEEALKAVTIHGAYQYGEEREKGSLTPGKKADLVILDRNPVEAAPEELREIQVLETIKEGKTVFSRKGQK